MNVLCAHGTEPSVFASCAKDGTVRLWNAFSGKDMFMVESKRKEFEATEIALGNGRNSMTLLMATVESGEGPTKVGHVQAYDCDRAVSMFKHEAHGEMVSCISWFSEREDRSLFLTGGEYDGTVRLWDLEAKSCVLKMVHWQGDPGKTINSLSACSNGHLVQSCGSDNICTVHDIRLPERPLFVLRHGALPDLPPTGSEANRHSGVTCGRWASMDRLLFTCGEDALLHVWDVSHAGEEVFRFAPPIGMGSDLQGLCVSPDDDYVAFGGDNSIVHVVSLSSQIGCKVMM